MRITALEAFGVDEQIIQAWQDSGHENLLPVQVEAVTKGNVLNGGNAVVFSPTSSGKTFVGEMAAIHVSRRDRRVLYLVPQKALAEEKYREFSEKYSPFGVRVAISTRDRKEYDTAISHGAFDIAVIVFEKLQSLLLTFPDILRKVGLAIIDELQMIGDETRGPGLEILLTKILLSENRPQIIGLSAVLGNAQSLANWLEATLIEERKRPVELRKGVLWNGQFRHIEHNTGNEAIESFDPPAAGMELAEIVVSGVCRFAERGEQCIVFCKSRNDSMDAARRIADFIRMRPATETIEELQNQEESEGKDLLLGLLDQGVAYHNTNLDREQRDIIERGFRRGEIAVLCATSTLAMGINLPVRNVFIDTDRYIKSKYGNWDIEAISQAEFENMAGRAGRLGMDAEFGRAIIVADSEFRSKVLFDVFAKGSLGDIQPTLSHSPLSQHVLSLIASGLCTNQDEICNILLQSYTGRQIWCNDDEQDFRKKVSAAVELCLSGGLLTNTESGLQATALGRLTATQGVSVDTSVQMAEFAAARSEASPTIDPLEVLWCLTGTECGKAIHFNMSTREFNSREYLRVLHDHLEQLSESVKRRLLPEVQNCHYLYEDTKRLKKTLLLYDWIAGKTTREIELTYHCFVGSVHTLAIEFAWLADSLGSVANILEWPEDGVVRLKQIARQLAYGVPIDGVGLASLKVPGLGRARISALTARGIITLEDVESVSHEELRKLVTKPVAEKLVRIAQGSDADSTMTEPNPQSTLTNKKPEKTEGSSGKQCRTEHTFDGCFRSNCTIHLDGQAKKRRHLVLIDGKEAWLTAQGFETALLLAVAAKNGRLGWLSGTAICRDNYYQIIRRMKKDISSVVSDVDALVENNSSKQYRFSVPPENITWDGENIVLHAPEMARLLESEEHAA